MEEVASVASRTEYKSSSIMNNIARYWAWWAVLEGNLFDFGHGEILPLSRIGPDPLNEILGPGWPNGVESGGGGVQDSWPVN